jgi:hypothetical protein
MRSLEINYLPCVPKQSNPYSFNNFVKPKGCYADLKSKRSLKNKLDESKRYVGSPAITIFINNQRMDLAAYGEKRIVNEMTTFNRGIDIKNVYWHKALISADILEDETLLFNIGVPTEDPVYKFELEGTYPSIMTSYPYNYKFTGIEFQANNKR